MVSHVLLLHSQRMAHVNVVRLFDAFEDEQEVHLVTKWIVRAWLLRVFLFFRDAGVTLRPRFSNLVREESCLSPLRTVNSVSPSLRPR